MEVDLDNDSRKIGTHSCDAIKDRFKELKRKNPPPDLSQLVDFDVDSRTTYQGGVVQCQLHITEDEKPLEECGLVSPKYWKAYSLTSHPGLVFIRNPFTASGQRYWAGRCLRDLPAHPNKTNLDTHGLLQDQQKWWELCLNGNDWSRLKKLRWVTLGFHHDWDSKLYNLCDRSPFPADLAALSALVARAAGCAAYAAQAAIVNFYHADSTLAPHTDRSELDVTAPLLSFSFGQSAIFLLGGPERRDAPAAMLVRSGDVIVMSGRSRLSYHAVPRILPATDPRWQDTCKRKLANDGDDVWPAGPSAKQVRRASDTPAVPAASRMIVCECTGSPDRAAGSAGEDPVVSYLSRSRINMNVRQVLPISGALL